MYLYIWKSCFLYGVSKTKGQTEGDYFIHPTEEKKSYKHRSKNAFSPNYKYVYNRV